MQNWTTEQVLAFAPSASIAKNAQKTAIASKWQQTGKNDRAVWGLCKGSGQKPYQTVIDLNNAAPAFKCTCPTRAASCKHALALLLLYANNSLSFENANPPEWAAEWLKKRDAKAAPPHPELQETQDLSEELKAKLQAQAEKRRANFLERVELMRKGLTDFEKWLKDIIHQGIASFEREPYSFWEDASTRLVDAKAKSAANFIREIPTLINQSADWYEEVLVQLSDLYAVIQGIKNIEQLPEALQNDVLSVAGYTIKKQDLLAQEGIKDNWQVLGKKEGKGIDPNMYYRKIWLKGITSNKYALLLDYSFGGKSFDQHFAVGTFFKGELVFFPSNYPQRARLKTLLPENGYLSELDGATNLKEILKDYATALAANPWLMELPVMINQVTPFMNEAKLMLIDANNDLIPIQDRELMGWQLLALSGGHPISIFGEWTGSALIPLSAFVNGRFVEMSILQDVSEFNYSG